MPEAAEEQIDESPATASQPETPPAAPLAVNFSNPAAVRTAVLASLIGYLLLSFPVPLPIIWPLIALIAAGGFAVYLYERRTGESLSVLSGARMGWLTGVFTFAIATIFFTLGVLLISQQGGLANFYREHLPGIRVGDPNMEKVLEYLQDPAGLGVFLFLSLAVLFVMFTILPTLGGALGAKVLERDKA